MKTTVPRRLSCELLKTASTGLSGALSGVERRVAYLRDGGRVGIAGLLGELTADQQSAVCWLRNWMFCRPNSMKRYGVSEVAQCRVFELVYPLVAQLPEVSNPVLAQVSASPMMLAVALRVNREVLGTPLPPVDCSARSARLSPLCCAIFGGEAVESEVWRHTEAIRLLVEAGADLEFRDAAGLTPLLYYVRHWPRCGFVVEQLLKLGANPLARPYLGGNLLHQLTWMPVAKQSSEHAKLARLLVQVLPRETLRRMLSEGRDNDYFRRPFEVCEFGVVRAGHDSAVHRVLLEAAKSLGVDLTPIAA